jgi:hypothetical protein
MASGSRIDEPWLMNEKRRFQAQMFNFSDPYSFREKRRIQALLLYFGACKVDRRDCRLLPYEIPV